MKLRIIDIDQHFLIAQDSVTHTGKSASSKQERIYSQRYDQLPGENTILPREHQKLKQVR